MGPDIDGLLEEYLSRERVAGWDREESLAAVLRDMLCGSACSYSRALPVPVVTWRERACLIESSLGKIECSVMPPYTGDVSIEAVLTRDLETAQGKIVLLSTTDYPDNVWVLYNMAVENGAVAVIFYDYYPGRRRRVVVSGEWGYWLDKRVSPPIPAVHVRLESLRVLRRLVGEKISIYVSSYTREATGYTVEAYYTGAREDEILVSAHHDSWLSGFRDDAINVLVLPVIGRYLETERRRSLLNSLRVVSFTAEEFGDPKSPGWYWAYGSRYYLERDLWRHERPLVAVVMDIAYREPLQISYSVPDLAASVKDSMKNISCLLEDFGHPYMDSVSFIRHGIPVVTLHNFHDIYPLYHTDLDVASGGWHMIVSRLAQSILSITDTIDMRRGLATRLLEEYVRESFPSTIQDTVLDMISSVRYTERAYDLYSCFTKTLKPVVIDSYKRLYSDIILRPLPHTMILSGEAERLIISGEERYIEKRETEKILSEILQDIEDMRMCLRL